MDVIYIFLMIIYGATCLGMLAITLVCFMLVVYTCVHISCTLCGHVCCPQCYEYSIEKGIVSRVDTTTQPLQPKLEYVL